MKHNSKECLRLSGQTGTSFRKWHGKMDADISVEPVLTVSVSTNRALGKRINRFERIR